MEKPNNNWIVETGKRLLIKSSDDDKSTTCYSFAIETVVYFPNKNELTTLFASSNCAEDRTQKTPSSRYVEEACNKYPLGPGTHLRDGFLWTLHGHVGFKIKVGKL